MNLWNFYELSVKQCSQMKFRWISRFQEGKNNGQRSQNRDIKFSNNSYHHYSSRAETFYENDFFFL